MSRSVSFQPSLQFLDAVLLRKAGQTPINAYWKTLSILLLLRKESLLDDFFVVSVVVDRECHRDASLLLQETAAYDICVLIIRVI